MVQIPSGMLPCSWLENNHRQSTRDSCPDMQACGTCAYLPEKGGFATGMKWDKNWKRWASPPPQKKTKQKMGKRPQALFWSSFLSGCFPILGRLKPISWKVLDGVSTNGVGGNVPFFSSLSRFFLLFLAFLGLFLFSLFSSSFS